MVRMEAPTFRYMQNLVVFVKVHLPILGVDPILSLLCQKSENTVGFYFWGKYQPGFCKTEHNGMFILLNTSVIVTTT